MEYDQPSPIGRNEGVTAAERFLQRLCELSFLRLWSYPGIFRDQGNTKGGDGKEICDLIVVFGDHVIIFSDKDIAFPKSGTLELDWKRWYSRAVVAGAAQVWGAERWIRRFPHRVFVDRKCLRPFPFDLPTGNTAIFHRIVVAHGASSACQASMGGTGSLMYMGQVPLADTMPFVLSDVDPSRGFVHVLDDVALDVVMKECDTITDFVDYLTKKERFVRTGKLLVAAGEDDLVAYYLRQLNSEGEHDFLVDTGAVAMIDEGFYQEYLNSEERKAKRDADQISYSWDALIEKFSGNLMAGTLYKPSTPSIEYHEQGLRLLARESRVRRRMLSLALIGILERATAEPHLNKHVRVLEGGGDEPFYVFLVLKQPEKMGYDGYRAARRNILLSHCRVLRLLRPSAKTIVGLTMEQLDGDNFSEDLVVYDGTSFPDAERRLAIAAQSELGIFKDIKRFSSVISEYPKKGATGLVVKPMPKRGGRFPGTGRNDPCPCEGGAKYKKCCGP